MPVVSIFSSSSLSLSPSRSLSIPSLYLLLLLSPLVSVWRSSSKSIRLVAYFYLIGESGCWCSRRRMNGLEVAVCDLRGSVSLEGKSARTTEKRTTTIGCGLSFSLSLSLSLSLPPVRDTFDTSHGSFLVTLFLLCHSPTLSLPLSLSLSSLFIFH